jgi:hypothetical protein
MEEEHMREKFGYALLHNYIRQIRPRAASSDQEGLGMLKYAQIRLAIPRISKEWHDVARVWCLGAEKHDFPDESVFILQLQVSGFSTPNGCGSPPVSGTYQHGKENEHQSYFFDAVNSGGYSPRVSFGRSSHVIL